MSKDFLIYVDRLKEGQTEKIEEESSSSFLDIQEEELSFPSPVSIRGKAYLAEDHLVIQLDIRTEFVMPCSICNENITLPIEINNLTHVEPLAEIPSHIFDYTELLREDILLHVPPFAECQEGHCPQRAAIGQYLKKEAKGPSSAKQEDVHYPFADL